jgi:hypothetical protein
MPFADMGSPVTNCASAMKSASADVAVNLVELQAGSGG